MATTPVARFGSATLMTLVAVTFLGIGIVAGWRFTSGRPAPIANRLPTVRYTIPAGDLPALESPRVSRDGRQIAYVASKTNGPRAIWIQPLDGEPPREVPGTSGASSPFWSPDGRSLGFFAEGALKRVELAGGAPQRLVTADDLLEATWSSTGIIVFSQRYALSQVPATGGTPSPVASLDLSRQENSLRQPEFLPDGRRFVYVARSGRPENTSAYLASVDGGAPTRLFTTRSAVRLASPDRLLYVRDDALVTQSIDANQRRTVGEPRQIVGGIDPNLLGPIDFFSVSDTGVLVYRLPVATSFQLAWVDRSGRVVSTIGEPSNISNFRLSPDERRLALDESGRRLRSVWTVDLATGARTRLTFAGWDDWQPIWSPDGLRILFGSYRDGPINLYIKPADGSGSDDVFMQSSIQKGPRDWSKDGRFVLYTQDSSELKEDLFARHAAGNDTPIVIAATEAREFDGRFSFDARWVSYVSNETGTDEVYVQPFPPTGGKWQVSSGGGHSPRWRADGRELFYLSSSGDMEVVSITAGPSFVASAPRTLFTMAGIAPGSPGNTSYEVTRDGQRFLIKLTKGAPPASPISVILNWANSSSEAR
jgi:Tol biopolymer transport system component